MSGTEGERQAIVEVPAPDTGNAWFWAEIVKDVVKRVEGGNVVEVGVRERMSWTRVSPDHEETLARGRAAQALEPQLEGSAGIYAMSYAHGKLGGQARPRAALIKTLKGFIGYLDKMGVSSRTDWDDELDWHHVLHKYVYIAKKFGVRLGYDFDFLESGAFSADMQTDLHGLDSKDCDAETLAEDQRVLDAFIALVRGKGTEWLQIATFAVRERDGEQADGEFTKKGRMHTRYDRRIAKDAYERVNACMKDIPVSSS